MRIEAMRKKNKSTQLLQHGMNVIVFPTTIDLLVGNTRGRHAKYQIKAVAVWLSH